ncbi:MAG: hypothetical protein U1F36_01840 [Planctomycetota bacterium]
MIRFDEIPPDVQPEPDATPMFLLAAIALSAIVALVFVFMLRKGKNTSGSGETP